VSVVLLVLVLVLIVGVGGASVWARRRRRRRVFVCRLPINSRVGLRWVLCRDDDRDEGDASALSTPRRPSSPQRPQSPSTAQQASRATASSKRKPRGVVRTSAAFVNQRELRERRRQSLLRIIPHLEHLLARADDLSASMGRDDDASDDDDRDASGDGEVTELIGDAVVGGKDAASRLGEALPTSVRVPFSRASSTASPSSPPAHATLNRRQTSVVGVTASPVDGGEPPLEEVEEDPHAVAELRRVVASFATMVFRSRGAAVRELRDGMLGVSDAVLSSSADGGLTGSASSVDLGDMTGDAERILGRAVDDRGEVPAAVVVSRLIDMLNTMLSLLRRRSAAVQLAADRLLHARRFLQVCVVDECHML
jgi:hypothetical protein